MSVHLFKERLPRIGIQPATLRYNELWVLSLWNPHSKKYVPDNGPLATLRMMGHGPIEAAPPIYRGRLPSPEAIRFCAQQQRAHEEWVDRRAYLTSDVE